MATIADDIVALKPSEIGLALAALIKEREPCMIVGAPGIGKTDVTGQAAELADNELLTIHPVLGDPTDGKGMPWFEKGKPYAVFLPFDDAWQIINAKEPLTVFLDDLGQAMPAVQASWMRPVLNRMIAGHKIPDHVTFIGATNRRTDKAGVSGILEPVKGRFTILHMRSDVNDFCDNLLTRGTSYGLSDDAITSGVAFIRFRKDLLNQFSPTADMTNSPTERNWVAAFKHTDKGMPTHIEHALIAGRVGSGAAAEFLGFLKIFRDLPSLEAIIADPDHGLIPESPAARYAVSAGLANMANEQNFERVTKYAARLEQAKHGEFAVLMMRDAIRRHPKLQNSNAWIKLGSSQIGKLLIGRAA